MKESLRRLIYKTFRASHVEWLATALGLFKPRVVAMLDGGLGSQMWQFALGYSVAKGIGAPLWLDASFYGTSGCGADTDGKNNRRFLLMETFPEIREAYAGRIARAQELRYYKLLFTDKYYPREHFWA